MNYYLNGSDVKTQYGMDISNGVNMLMQLPTRKQSISNDFEDQNGLDIDLAVPKFSARQFIFECLITAPTISALQQFYFGLFSALKAGETYSLYNDYLQMTVNIYYIKQTNLGNIYRTSKAGYGIKFQLNFGERDALSNIPIVVLVDDEYNVLVP